MSRRTLIGTCAGLGLGFLASAGLAFNPHLDPSRVTGGCNACHRGHGVSRSPMLPAPQEEVCLSCHGAKGDADRQIQRGLLSANAAPQLMATNLRLPYAHPLTPGALSRREPTAVTCTSCHTPHLGSAAATASLEDPPGFKKVSPRDPNRLEYQLCQDCHGSEGIKAQTLLDLSRITSPTNRSFHPIEAPSLGHSPSVIERLSGKEINCTDCHGNSNPGGPRGVHGSGVQYILRQDYTTVDGSSASTGTYALCYSCHLREEVLSSESPFPLHRLHVVDERSSCATCHNAHGSVGNRALIRFGEETTFGAAGPSPSTGQLAYFSDSPGSGLCFLSCHGEDHSPLGYGAMATPKGSTLASPGTMGILAPGLEPWPSLPEAPKPGPEKERKKLPPP